MEANITGIIETLEALEIQLVSFMNIGNVTMVTMFVENSKIQRAVDLQRRVNCDKFHLKQALSILFP
jgi:hypothetical protein